MALSLLVNSYPPFPSCFVRIHAHTQVEAARELLGIELEHMWIGKQFGWFRGFGGAGGGSGNHGHVTRPGDSPSDRSDFDAFGSGSGSSSSGSSSSGMASQWSQGSSAAFSASQGSGSSSQNVGSGMMASSTSSSSRSQAEAAAASAALQLWREAAKRGHPGAQLAVATQLSSPAFLGHALGSNASSLSRLATATFLEEETAASAAAAVAGKGLYKDVNQGEVRLIFFNGQICFDGHALWCQVASSICDSAETNRLSLLRSDVGVRSLARRSSLSSHLDLTLEYVLWRVVLPFLPTSDSYLQHLSPTGRSGALRVRCLDERLHPSPDGARAQVFVWRWRSSQL